MSPIGSRPPAGGPPPEAAPAPAPTEAAPAPAPVPAEAAPATPPPDAEPAPAPTPETISDDDLAKAVKFLLAGGKATVFELQRVCKFPYKKAKTVIEVMEERGLIGLPTKPENSREILVTKWPPDATTTPDTPLTRAGGAAADLDTTATAAPVDTETAPAEPAPEPPPVAEPEPPPAEPAPVTPEPATPPVEPALVTTETPPETPEAPPAPPTPESKSRWESIKSTFTGAYDRFLSKFRGEAQPEEEKDYKGSWGDVTRNATMGLISVVASYTGVKFFGDLGARAWQTLISNPAERKRIQEALLAKEAELGETTEPSAIDQKKARLEEAINASKFLTAEKKTQLLADLHKKVAEYEEKDRSQRAIRDKDIVDILKKAIQTRVKNAQLLKEGLNTALMVTGLAAMRGVAYGAVATYERHQEIAKRLEEKSKKEEKKFEKDKAFYKEWIVDGFTQTLHNLVGGKEKFLSAKGGMNVVKGATNVLRALGFADLAIAEWTGEGRSVSSIIETSLKAWEDKGVAAGWENFKAPTERLVGLARGDIRPFGLDGSTAEPGAGAAPPPEAWRTNEELGESDATEPADREVSGETVGEVTEAQVEAGLVKKGDGILKILERQGVEAKAALEAAREAGIVRAGGDTRLTTEAIGRLSVLTETQPDGGIEIKFFDTQTDKVLSLAEARDAGFTYESGTVPGEIPTDREIVEHIPEPTPDVEVLGDSPAPNDLLGDTFHIYTDKDGNFTSLDAGEGDMLTRMNDAIQELARAGHGESPEAKFIFEQYTALLASEGVEPAEDLPPAEAAERAIQEIRAREGAVDKVTGSAVGEPIKKFVGEAGKVKFVYNKSGDVRAAWMPEYTPGRRDIEDSLKEWGLTTKQVKDHFSEGKLYRWFVRDAERLTRQETLLYEMQKNGYSNSLEYSHLKKETERLEEFVTKKMTKEFKIKQ